MQIANDSLQRNNGVDLQKYITLEQSNQVSFCEFSVRFYSELYMEFLLKFFDSWPEMISKYQIYLHSWVSRPLFIYFWSKLSFMNVFFSTKASKAGLKFTKTYIVQYLRQQLDSLDLLQQEHKLVEIQYREKEEACRWAAMKWKLEF